MRGVDSDTRRWWGSAARAARRGHRWSVDRETRPLVGAGGGTRPPVRRGRQDVAANVGVGDKMRRRWGADGGTRPSGLASARGLGRSREEDEWPWEGNEEKDIGGKEKERVV